MTARSNASTVPGIDKGALGGPALSWAAEQAHIEGRRLELVTAVVGRHLKQHGETDREGRSSRE